MLGAFLMPLGNVVAAQKTNADASQCSKEILHNFVVRNKPESKGGLVQGTVDIWNTAGGKTFFYVSRVDVDADGAPQRLQLEKYRIGRCPECGRSRQLVWARYRR
jgi:hypothetical protein